MKVNPEAPASPFFETNGNGYGDTLVMPAADGSSVYIPFGKGMNIRTQIAAMAMQGLLSNRSEETVSHGPQYVAKKSVMYTDALIAELNK